MITKDSIESAYCFFHQKCKPYVETQKDYVKDHIEWTIADYVEQMNPELYQKLSNGREHYLQDHTTFRADIDDAVAQLEKMA